MNVIRFIPFFATVVWLVRRMRGSEMRKHGGWQLWPVILAMSAAVGLLLLTGCNDKIVNRPVRARSTAAVVSTSVPPVQVQPTPAPVQAAPAGGPTPCPNGVVPPPTPDLIWCDGSSPDCQPTPDFRPAKYPCATNAEIDGWLQGDQP